MPRSRLSNWVSTQRLRFIDDALASLGYIRREMVANYFCCDLSLASMDLTAYQQAGGKIHIEIGLWESGKVRPVGIKSGGKPFYVRNPDWHSVFNSTPARQDAWAHIHATAPNNNVWFQDRRLDWIDDHWPCDASDVTAYFKEGGDSAMAAYNTIAGTPGKRFNSNPERAKAWARLA